MFPTGYVFRAQPSALGNKTTYFCTVHYSFQARSHIPLLLASPECFGGGRQDYGLNRVCELGKTGCESRFSD